MPNLFDYLKWRGDLTLSQSGFQAVDSLILCCLSYLSFEAVIPGEKMDEPLTIAEAAKLYFHLHPSDAVKKDLTGFSKNDTALLALLSDSPRFARMRLQCYVSKTDYSRQEQFAAVTVLPGDGSVYIAYRGTDDTLVGWKEDFNMSFLYPVPSQQEALQYLVRAAGRFPGPIRVGGHSKGGNLAVYSASFCPNEIRSRITDVYNNDGPGFHKNLKETPGFRSLSGRLHTYVPQSSVIGMLLEHEDHYTVIRSTQIGLLQHDPYSWQIDRRDFVRLDTVNGESRFIDKTLRTWIEEMDDTHRARFVDALYDILTAANAKTVRELTAGWSKNAAALLKTCHTMDEDTKKLISKTLFALFRTAAGNFSNAMPGPTAKRAGR